MAVHFRVGSEPIDPFLDSSGCHRRKSLPGRLMDSGRAQRLRAWRGCGQAYDSSPQLSHDESMTETSRIEQTRVRAGLRADRAQYFFLAVVLLHGFRRLLPPY